MSSNSASVVLVHGAWADGSSWAKVAGPFAAAGTRVVAAPLPLTSFADDVVALNRALERVNGPVVLAGHAYAGAVIGATRDEKVKALAPNAPAEEQALLAAVQRPISPACITVRMERSLWKDKPSWFLVAEEDRMIVHQTQRFMAQRMQAVVRSHPVDHTPLATAPAVVANIIREARAAIAAP